MDSDRFEHLSCPRHTEHVIHSKHDKDEATPAHNSTYGRSDQPFMGGSVMNV